MGNEESFVQAEGGSLEFDPTRNYSKRTKRLHHRLDFKAAIGDFQDASSRTLNLPAPLQRYVNRDNSSGETSKLKHADHEYAAHPDPTISVEDRFLGLQSKQALISRFRRLCDTDVENAKDILETLISVLDEATQRAAKRAMEEAAASIREPSSPASKSQGGLSAERSQINIYLRTR